MQRFIFYVLSVCTIILLCQPAKAQTKDTIFIKAKDIIQQKDSTYMVTKLPDGRYDTIILNNTKLSISNGDIYYLKNDSLIKFNRAKSYSKHDSAFKRSTLEFKRNSDAFEKRRDDFEKSKADFKKSQSYYKAKDSAYSIHKKRYDQTNFKQLQYKRLDSLKSLNWRKDSVRIKGELNRLKSDLNRLKMDSVRSLKKLQPKVVSMETNCKKNATISINNPGRKLTIKTFNEGKIKLETTISAEENFNIKNFDWEKELGILITKDNKEITIAKAANHSSPLNNQTDYKINNKSPLIVYVPAGVQLTITNSYNAVNIMDNMEYVSLNLTNANLQMQHADKAIIKSKYGSVKAGNIKDADIELINCKFSSGNIEKLLIKSKYSTVVFENTAVADIKSVSDQYEMENAGYVTAQKMFGKLEIAKLKNSIVLTGASADLDIKAIEATTKTVKVDNKYAALKLPVENILNYTMQFDGANSNITTVGEKFKTTANANSNTSFTKTMGSQQNSFTAFVLNCVSCSVDLR